MKFLKAPLWIVFLTLALTKLWGHYPRAIPVPPEWFVNFLIRVYQPMNAEEVSDLELLYSLVVCFIVSCIFYVGFRAIKRRIIERS